MAQLILQSLEGMDITLALSSAILGTFVGESKALAAKRRPPTPEEETTKNDPNVSGVMAKVLASKKRKEAMKESMAKLREKGKSIETPPPQ
ncbi:uncharacterized protein LOC105421757 isoform X2 [Amborella trichopoda]|uniref:uncharacterized protein LOC105421757 isoform X2 n=1 Tax=Amborella trichopoda TaxID=13333 RepID=UPI0005D370C0|nr:uncharacterized protein LOC105421757 isoform X2 [Amborella trichopoda]|eukprot:XP_011628717.1 uncharacterized protein LOC105421757 isoform X2 [Amborella trichopoda]